MTGVQRHPLVRRIALGVTTLAAALAVGAGVPPASTAAPLQVAKTCSAGYTHAVIGGAEKCLRSGEFCARRYDTQYRRYGYRCVRYYANVARYRLTRG